MTYEEALEYVWQAHEAEAEQFAEWGSGATSLGYNAGEWALTYDGYRCSTDETYREAQAVIAAWRAENTPDIDLTPRTPTPDDEEIPF